MGCSLISKELCDAFQPHGDWRVSGCLHHQSMLPLLQTLILACVLAMGLYRLPFFWMLRLLIQIPGKHQFSSVQSLSRVGLFATPWTAARQASLSITNSQSLLKLVSIELVMPSNHLILCHPLLFPPSIFPSIRVSSNESAPHIRCPKCWSFSYNITPSNEYSGLISFRIDWLDLLAVQRTLKSLLQQHSSKASILQCSAFFIAQLSHSYMTAGKTIALTRWTFVGEQGLQKNPALPPAGCWACLLST